jgi:hypothetical protein
MLDLVFDYPVVSEFSLPVGCQAMHRIFDIN